VHFRRYRYMAVLPGPGVAWSMLSDAVSEWQAGGLGSQHCGGDGGSQGLDKASVEALCGDGVEAKMERLAVSSSR
jgi:hypothetical protein